MSWMQVLAETYDNCHGYIGYTRGVTRPLLPICHISIQAHIEVVIDGKGNFRRARLVDKDESTTIIPATEDSASRSGGKPKCHPLSDKLQYLAGDFTQYGGVVTSGFSKDPEEPYRNFIDLLTQWCQSAFSHPKACAVLAYVKKKRLMRDLVDQKILLIGSNGMLLTKKEVKREKNAKDIFAVVDPQYSAVVRWIVESSDSDEHRTWLDQTLWDSWIKFYLNSKHTDEKTDLCLVTGQKTILTTSHPKYIRREGDRAKLISSNDTNGFTFRGRFLTDEQACSVGLETSHKAHYALAWLINRQGYLVDDLAVVAWATSGQKMIQPIDDPVDALDDDIPSETVTATYLAQEVALRLKKKIAGYRQELGDTSQMAIIAIDSATTGRLSIVYYRELSGSEFLDRIERWHETCSWRHTYHFVEEIDENGKRVRRSIPFIGAPAPTAIAEAAYGRRLDAKLKKATIKRLLPCIVEGQPIPFDLVESVVRNASHPVSMSTSEWNKALTIACALFRKFNERKEMYDMSLDETRTTRDYLFGRLLAIADVLEERALSEAEKDRPTNALRYMQQFSQRPFQTWNQIHNAIVPYLMRLGDKAYYYKKLMADVTDMFDPEDFVSNRPLSGEYLLGYYSQRQKLWGKKTEAAINDIDDKETSED